MRINYKIARFLFEYEVCLMIFLHIALCRLDDLPTPFQTCCTDHYSVVRSPTSIYSFSCIQNNHLLLKAELDTA